MEYLSVNILLSTNHNLNLYLIVGGVVLFILIFMINKVIDGTREKLEDEDVELDMNHPLAGMNLNFDVEIVDVRVATDEELEHGHVHGPGGHEH